MKKSHTASGFTLIELLIVVAIIGIISAIAIPGLLRARQSGNEASAIGSVRAVNSGEANFASTCGGGGFATTNGQLFEPPPNGQPFISADLENANALPGKSGYIIVVARNADPLDLVVLAGGRTCNGVGDSRSMFFVSADPITRGQNGTRSFASDQRGTIYFDNDSAVPNPIPAALQDYIQ